MINKMPNTQHDFRKGFSTSDDLLLLTHELQVSLNKRAELRVVSTRDII